MNNASTKSHIPDDLRKVICKELNRRNNPAKTGMLRILEGKLHGQIICTTISGEIICNVLQDGQNLYFEMPSGTNDQVAPKVRFFQELFSAAPSH